MVAVKEVRELLTLLRLRQWKCYELDTKMLTKCQIWQCDLFSLAEGRRT